MAAIVLGKRPKSFTRTITVPLHNGEQGMMKVQFKYRTRTEFGALVDELVAAAKVPPPASQAGEDVVFSLATALEQTRDTNADYLLKIMEGWDLDAPFGLDALVQLCDELPGAALAIIEDYRAACTEGRLGN